MAIKALKKTEIAEKFAAANEMSIKDATATLEKVFTFVAETLKAGEAVKIKNVGTLRRVDRPAHVARIPNSDKTAAVPARYGFKLASKSFDVE